jgi:hypothetical protein
MASGRRKVCGGGAYLERCVLLGVLQRGEVRVGKPTTHGAQATWLEALESPRMRKAARRSMMRYLDTVNRIWLNSIRLMDPSPS